MATVPIAAGTGGLAVGEGAVWALSAATSTLTRIDPATNKIAAQISVKTTNPCPPFPDSCDELAAGDGAVWVSLVPDNTVARIDPQTNTVTALIPVGSQPEGIAVSPEAIWVANRGGPSVSRIDPATNTVVATIPIGPSSACCSGHIALTARPGAVWATVPNLSAIVRIDPARNAVTATTKLSSRVYGQPCAFIVADARSVWAAGGHCAADVARIDPRTNKPSGRILGLRSPIGLGLGFGSLWIADLDAKTIERADPRTARVVGRLKVGGYPVRLGIGFHSIWIRDDKGRVLRIDPR